MIHDVDESLRTLVRRDVLTGSDVEVVLDAPTRDWAARRNAPTLDFYLYDIREATGLRQTGERALRNDDGNIIARQPWPRRFRLSYLVTAWTQRPEDEHRLLSAVLGCFLRFDSLPPAVLAGALTAAGEPIPFTVAVPPPQDRAISDVWSAMGGELKASLDLVVTAPFAAGLPVETGRPVLEPPLLRVTSQGASLEDRQRPRRDKASECR